MFLGICSLPNIKPIARKLESTDGAEIAEAALVLPLVFIFIFGIIWFGLAFHIYGTIQQAAQQGATTAARSTCASCTNPNALPDPNTAVDPVVVAVLEASGLRTGKIILAPKPILLPCPAPAPQGTCTKTDHNIWVCSSVLLNSASQPPQCGAMVSFRYSFDTLNLMSLTPLPSIKLSAQAQSRMEN
jgi:hypothetical protein